MGRLIGDPLDEFLRLNCPFFISYGVHICNERGLHGSMLAKCSNVERQAYSPIGHYFPSLKKQAADWQYVRARLEEGNRPVRTRYQVGLLASSHKIAKEEQTLFNLYRPHRWELARDKFMQLPAFLSALPMTWGEGAAEDARFFQRTKTTLSHEPSNLMPLQGEWQGTTTPGMLLSGRRGQLFYWNPFDNNEGNFNTCVVGRSGSGKSVFMQELMTSILGLGGRVFVLDVGRSFEKTVKILGGTYLEFSASSNICVNPFSAIPLNNDKEALEALGILKPILSLMAAPKMGTDDLEDSFLEQAIHDAWKRKGQHATITDIESYLLAHKDEKAQSLGERLYSFTENGQYGRFFNGPANINLSDNMVVVELEELNERPDLQSVIVQMVIIQIINAVYLGDRQTPAVLFLDEGWDLIRGKQGGDFFEKGNRRFRKYKGAIVIGTQSVNDFYANPSAQAAFDNADWLCLLSQKDESIDFLKTTGRLSMDPHMERTLRSLRTEQGKYAEILIKGNFGYAVGRLMLDPFSKVLYSTKAEEFSAVQKLHAQGLSLKEAISHVAKERYGG